MGDGGAIAVNHDDSAKIGACHFNRAGSTDRQQFVYVQGAGQRHAGFRKRRQFTHTFPRFGEQTGVFQGLRRLACYRTQQLNIVVVERKRRVIILDCDHPNDFICRNQWNTQPRLRQLTNQINAQFLHLLANIAALQQQRLARTNDVASQTCATPMRANGGCNSAIIMQWEGDFATSLIIDRQIKASCINQQTGLLVNDPQQIFKAHG